ncbi:tripartite tricarboxylate transporter TctB family protein [Roseitranquillus sediminis]|uniref:tripartite tricarboxylate transporter TctB family protein n=1 Tax=Roseitranquillus sediminis TaxID=2809051 RepID=UPI001D0C2253|nr:tripartite tricarboxylate transporter TctB family protein [Roseitranquillus sediminis]MBM9593856.1 tripartite tricarboxylate transporter TctB family protein [Roseitranquillus sediminis]
MTDFRRSNRFVGLVLLIGACLLFAYIWLSPWAHREMRDGFTLGFFPLIGAGAMVLCAAVMLFDPLRREVPDGLAGAEWSDAVLALAMLAGIAAYAVAMQAVGFLEATPIFTILYMLWMGFRPVRSAVLLGVLIPIGTFALFTILGVSLPLGPLSSLL